MTSSDVVEPTQAALDAASEAVRVANYAAFNAPATPESLYGRSGALVEILERLRQVAFTLGDHVERAASDAAGNGEALDTDDDVPAAEYAYDARRLLADVAASIEDGARIANQAHSALSHLKLSQP